MDLISGPVDRTSWSQAEIALFRSLFRGRDDVCPRRFESRTRSAALKSSTNSGPPGESIRTGRRRIGNKP
jgi:hypothetical protein